MDSIGWEIATTTRAKTTQNMPYCAECGHEVPRDLYSPDPVGPDRELVARYKYFGIIFGAISRTLKLCTTPHAPYAMLYVSLLIGYCWRLQSDVMPEFGDSGLSSEDFRQLFPKLRTYQIR